MTKKCAVFSCLGLGDGLISLVLSHNLMLNGYSVITYHPFLSQMQRLFPSLPLKAFSSPEEEHLEQFDRFFIFYERSPRMQAILSWCQTHYPKRTTVLNPIATWKTDYPYWEQGRFDGRLPFVQNLYRFCRDVLQFRVGTLSNGIVLPPGVHRQKFLKRVVLHPTSSRPGKNWDWNRFIRLAKWLQRQGWDPVLLVHKGEQRGSAEGVALWEYDRLEELALFVAESGAMIGNDSGIGHLSSCLGLSTLVICRSQEASDFWRPGWGKTRVVTPASWIPNVKGLRLRDRYWQKWISVRKVAQEFMLCEK